MSEVSQLCHWEPSSEMLRARRVVAESFGVSDGLLMSGSRRGQVSLARQAVCLVLRTVWPTLSYPCIAKVVGRNDHSTAIHACQRMRERIAGNAALGEQIAGLVRVLGERASLTQHDDHVRTWRRAMLEAMAERARERKRRSLAAEQVARTVSPNQGFRAVVAMGVETISLTRKVKPANELVDDDSDALRRKVGSDSLSRAIAAAGGWR